jgi:8-oxo-dGTP pyrophosphatase MutT (NUDIX family)
MSTVKTFSEFLNESWDDVDNSLEKKAAGVAIVYNNKILLVHPTNASWQKPTLGIPKGKVDKGEDILTAAIRELKEETGIGVNPRTLAQSEPYVVDLYDKLGNIEKQLIYFLYEISDLNEIGLQTERVPKTQLQQKEVDWAGFMEPDEAYPMTNRNQLIILDRHLNI